MKATADHLLRIPGLLIIGLTVLLISCGDSSTGTNGGNGDGNGNGNGDPPAEPTFANVIDIFNDSCGGSGCHIGNTTNGVRLDSYENIMDSEGTQYGEPVVQPGDAGGSPLVDKISPGTPEFGERMPQGGPYLSDDEIDLIRAWINNGAEEE